MAGGPLVGSGGGVRESAFGWAKGPGGQGEGSEAQRRDVVGGAAAGGQVTVAAVLAELYVDLRVLRPFQAVIWSCSDGVRDVREGD